MKDRVTQRYQQSCC